MEQRGVVPIPVPAGPPARILAVLIPVVAVALIAARAARDGLRASPDDPVSPWIIAVVTVAVGGWLRWRALTQRAELGPDGLSCRNLVTSFEVDWDRVESLIVLRRGPLAMVDLRIRSHRRRLRVGAATRFSDESAEVVLDQIRAHPDAAARLIDPRDDAPLDPHGV